MHQDIFSGFVVGAIFGVIIAGIVTFDSESLKLHALEWKCLHHDFVLVGDPDEPNSVQFQCILYSRDRGFPQQ